MLEISKEMNFQWNLYYTIQWKLYYAISKGTKKAAECCDSSCSTIKRRSVIYGEF